MPFENKHLSSSDYFMISLLEFYDATFGLQGAQLS